MTKNKDNKDIPVEIDIYNEEQKFWDNVKENATASIKQMKDAIKLQEVIIEVAISKVEEHKDK